jgi:hypothetical protein
MVSDVLLSRLAKRPARFATGRFPCKPLQSFEQQRPNNGAVLDPTPFSLR